MQLTLYLFLERRHVLVHCGEFEFCRNTLLEKLDVVFLELHVVFEENVSSESSSELLKKLRKCSTGFF